MNRTLLRAFYMLGGQEQETRRDETRKGKAGQRPEEVETRRIETRRGERPQVVMCAPASKRRREKSRKKKRKEREKRHAAAEMVVANGEEKNTCGRSRRERRVQRPHEARRVREWHAVSRAKRETKENARDICAQVNSARCALYIGGTGAILL